MELVLVEPEEIAASLTAEVAILMLTHVNYRTGAMHDMAAVTAAAHAEGILTVWDLAHSSTAFVLPGWKRSISRLQRCVRAGMS